MILEFSLLTDTNSRKYKEAIAIFLDLFPANERQSVNVIEERIVSGKIELLIAEINDSVAGFAILWNFEDLDFALLDYLATDRNLHGSGIGSALMLEVKRRVAAWNKDLIIEIECPGEGDNQVWREKRLHFYLQNGALILKNVPYLLPALDGTVPTAMLLMAIPHIQKNSYSGKEIKAVIQTIYARAYKKESDDEELQSFIHLVPEKVELTAAWE